MHVVHQSESLLTASVSIIWDLALVVKSIATFAKHPNHGSLTYNYASNLGHLAMLLNSAESLLGLGVFYCLDFH